MKNINEYLINIGQNKVVSDNFKKTMYSESDFEILLNVVSKGTLLNEHSHPSKQFGYCFEGSFEFQCNDEKFIVNEGDNYLIAGNVNHKAAFLKDIVALDFKYKCDLFNNEIKFNCMKTFDPDFSCISLEGYQIFLYENIMDHTLTFDLNKRYFILTYKDVEVEISGEIYKTSNISIYEIKCEKITIKKASKIIIIEKER